MTWTRLDDAWTDDQVLAELCFADRWHYLAMIQFCSRTQKYDGVLRAADARRCSDHPEPPKALDNLVAVGLVINLGNAYKVPLIDDHIPPPSVREESERAKIRKQRSRRHKEGDHSTCLPKYCDSAPVTGNVTRDVTSDTGTGQDRTGQAFDVKVHSEVQEEVPGWFEQEEQARSTESGPLPSSKESTPEPQDDRSPDVRPNEAEGGGLNGLAPEVVDRWRNRASA